MVHHIVIIYKKSNIIAKKIKYNRKCFQNKYIFFKNNNIEYDFNWISNILLTIVFIINLKNKEKNNSI